MAANTKLNYSQVWDAACGLEDQSAGTEQLESNLKLILSAESDPVFRAAMTDCVAQLRPEYMGPINNKWILEVRVKMYGPSTRGEGHQAKPGPGVMECNAFEVIDSTRSCNALRDGTAEALIKASRYMDDIFEPELDRAKSRLDPVVSPVQDASTGDDDPAMSRADARIRLSVLASRAGSMVSELSKAEHDGSNAPRFNKARAQLLDSYQLLSEDIVEKMRGLARESRSSDPHAYTKPKAGEHPRQPSTNAPLQGRSEDDGDGMNIDLPGYRKFSEMKRKGMFSSLNGAHSKAAKRHKNDSNGEDSMLLD